MNVSVRFYGVQRALAGIPEVLVPLFENGRISDVYLHIKGRFPALQLNSEDMLITVNNRISSMDEILSPDDRVTFLPHIGGG